MEYLYIIIGTGLMALSINSVFDPCGLVTGGFSGIAIVVKEWTKNFIDGGIPLWITNVGLNIPLFLIGIKMKGLSFVKKAVFGEFFLSAWLAVQPVWNLAGEVCSWLLCTAGSYRALGSAWFFWAGGPQAGRI